MSAPIPTLPRVGRAAMVYAREFGWRVFPLHSWQGGACTCGNADCKSPAKHPRTARGCLDATTDPATIVGWWTRWPDANVGVATGGGLVVIDVDPRHGGDDSLDDLRARLGAYPDTVEAITGSRGRHIYLRAPEGAEIRNSAGQLAPGVDVRAENGYVVAAPSNHASGGSYAWELSSRPGEVEVAEVPRAWLEAIAEKPNKPRALPGADGQSIIEGGRNETLFRRACSMRSAGFDAVAILAAIAAENETRCSPPLDSAEVRGIVERAAKYTPGLSPEYAAKQRRVEPTEDVGAKIEDTPAAEWSHKLYTTKGGAIRNTFANVCTIFRNASEFASLRYNEMILQPELDGEAISDARASLIREAIEHVYGFSPSGDAVFSALVAVASERSYHPVRGYLEALTWDGKERLWEAAATYLGASTVPVNSVMVRSWFVSAVARAMRPGCKVDTCLVLVGPQGAGKSTFFRVLGGEWFSDSAVDIESKDAMMQVNGAWIYELSELDSVTSRAHAGRIKAFVSSQEDKFRKPYGRAIEVVRRHNVIVGSTNEPQFLVDPTGARRFWCVSVARIDTAALTADRDQLWAEAVHAFRAGEGWWLAEEAEKAQRESVEAYQHVDEWEPHIAEWLHVSPPYPTTAKILRDCLHVAAADMSQQYQRRVAAIMGRLGYKSVSRYNADTKTTARCWLTPPHAASRDPA